MSIGLPEQSVRAAVFGRLDGIEVGGATIPVYGGNPPELWAEGTVFPHVVIGDYEESEDPDKSGAYAEVALEIDIYSTSNAADEVAAIADAVHRTITDSVLDLGSEWETTEGWRVRYSNTRFTLGQGEVMNVGLLSLRFWVNAAEE